MGADLNLVFAEKGAAAVLREMAKLRAEAKAAGKEQEQLGTSIQAKNKAVEKSIRDIERAYQQTRSPIEKLEAQAKQLAKAIGDTKLPDLDRKKAEAALEGVKRKIDETKAAMAANSDEAKRNAKIIQDEQDIIARKQAVITRAYEASRTPLQRLQQEAKSLKAAMADAKLPPIDRLKAEAALKGINNKILEASLSLEGVGTEAKRADSALTKTFGGAKTALLGTFATAVGAATATIALVIKTITDEMRIAQELADKAQATQLTVSASRNVVIRNLPGTSEETKRRVLDQNAELSARVGVSETAINLARAEALSASGGIVRCRFGGRSTLRCFTPRQV